MNIKTVVDKERGCGFRKPGGLYLRTEPGPMLFPAAGSRWSLKSALVRDTGLDEQAESLKPKKVAEVP